MIMIILRGRFLHFIPFFLSLFGFLDSFYLQHSLPVHMHMVYILLLLALDVYTLFFGSPCSMYQICIEIIDI
jgi:hypothetical protein